MSYPAFPGIAKPSNVYDVTPEDPGIISPMEDGSEISRARFTTSRLTFTLNWTAMPVADAETLLEFYTDTIKGCAQIFLWTHPDPKSKYYGVTFKMRIVAAPKFTKVPVDRFSTSLTIRGTKAV